MAARSSVAIELNTEYIKECIKKSGMSEAEISGKMGRSCTFAHTVVVRGRIGADPFPLFCSIIGADKDKALKTPVVKEEVAPATVTVSADYQKTLDDIKAELSEIHKYMETLTQMKINQDEEEKRFFVMVSRFFTEYKNNKKYGHW